MNRDILRDSSIFNRQKKEVDRSASFHKDLNDAQCEEDAWCTRTIHVLEPVDSNQIYRCRQVAMLMPPYCCQTIEARDKDEVKDEACFVRMWR